MNPPRADAGLIRPAGPTDPQVTVLSVRHADGTPLAVLANYGLHYVGGTGPGTVSADYYGAFCRMLESALGTARQEPPIVALLANGASGNVNNIDVTEPAAPLPPYERIRAVAGDLVAAVQAAVDRTSYASSAGLCAGTARLDLAVRKPSAARVLWAERVLAGGDAAPSHAMARVFAHETMYLKAFPERVAIPLQAFRIGELALCAVPCEVFAETGLAIREASPFATTAVMSLANGYYGYLPPPEQHALGGYETWPARSSCLEVDAEPKIRAAMQGILASLVK